MMVLFLLFLLPWLLLPLLTGSRFRLFRPAVSPVLQYWLSPETPPLRNALFRVGVFLLPTLIGMQVATQWIVYRYAYHPILGPPIAGQWYAPWRFVGWTWQFCQSEPCVYSGPLWVVALGGVLGYFGVGLAKACTQASRSSGRRRDHFTHNDDISSY